MIWSYILKALTIVAMSVAKFTFVPFVAMGFGFSWVEMFIYTAVGGILGLAIFMNFSKFLNILWKRFFPPKKAVDHRKARKYIHYWRRYGLFGVSFLAPILLTIPLGTFLAIRFGTPQKKIYMTMFVSILFWSATLSTVATFGIRFGGL